MWKLHLTLLNIEYMEKYMQQNEFVVDKEKIGQNGLQTLFLLKKWYLVLETF